MNKQTLETMLVQHAENLKAKREALFKAAGMTIINKDDLEDMRQSLILSGTIDGKNAEIREAQMAEKLAKHIQNVRQVEDAERRAKHEFDQALTDLDSTRYLIRVAELVE